MVKKNNFTKLSYKSILKVFWKEHFVCISLLLFYTLMNIIYPRLLQMVIDKGIVENNIKKIVFYSLITLLLIILSIIIGHLMRIKYVLLGQKITLGIKKKILSTFDNQSILSYKNYQNGEIISILENDIKHVEVLFTYLFSDFLTNILTIIGIGAILFALNGSIALLVIIITIIFALIQKRLGKDIKNISKSVSVSRGKLQSFEQEYLENYIDIRSSNRTNQFENKLWQYQFDLFDSEKKVAIIKSGTSVLGVSFQNVCLILTFLLGGLLVLLKYLTMGELFSLIIYVQKIYSPVTALFKTYMEMKKTQASFNRVKDLFYDTGMEDGNLIMKEPFSIIEFKNVKFGYTKENTLFKNLSFCVEKGTSVAIVGLNGTGKTTLLHLLLKNLEGYAGSILINGQELVKFKRNEYNKHFSYMGQKLNIYSGTVYENVTLFDYSVDRRKVEQALSKVGLLDELQKHYKGLDTLLGSGGITLSGGQAQKLNWARIFISDADILLLDEPTSALDLESEQRLCELLFETFKDKIIIAVTHRPEIIRFCKKIINIERIPMQEETSLKIGYKYDN